jgi:hypothetical protein
MPAYKRKEKREFKHFPRLPLEIQSLIWEFCIPQQHIIPVGHSTWWCYEPTRRKLCQLPSVARVCHEARRVALARAQRLATSHLYTISRRLPPSDTDEPPPPLPPVLSLDIPFNRARDILFLNTWPDPAFVAAAPEDKPHLFTLLSDVNVPVAIPSSHFQRSVSVLRTTSFAERKEFYLVLSREFVIHMPRGKALARKLFGLNADDYTIMIQTDKHDEIAPYELAYNMTRRGGHHGDMRFLIARGLEGWVDKWKDLTWHSLSALAVRNAEGAWAKFHNEQIRQIEEQLGNPDGDGDQSERMRPPEMPAATPVVLFRLCTKCRHGNK